MNPKTIPNPEAGWRAIPPLGWLLLLTCACLAPFLTKAFHIDDTLFLRAAEQIQKHPGDFYGFNINWTGTERSMVANFDNPPLACYYVALVTWLAGWSEPVLHLAFVLPALAAAWGTYSLATRYCARPLLAAAVAVLAPVFVVSATTLMCDMLMLAFWVWALVFFEKGLRGSTPLHFVASGLMAGLAFATKFTGLALVPLLAVYGFCWQLRNGAGRVCPLPDERKSKRSVGGADRQARSSTAVQGHGHRSEDAPVREAVSGANLAIGMAPTKELADGGVRAPAAQCELRSCSLKAALQWQRVLWPLPPLIVLVFVVGYGWMTCRLYGKNLLLAAIHESSALRQEGSFLSREITGLSFMGGCFLPSLCYAPILWSWRSLFRGLLLIVLCALFCSFLWPFDNLVWHGAKHPDWVLLLQTLLFITGGLHVLALAGSDLWQRRDVVSLLLLLWSGGIVLFATAFNWTCNGRSLLPMLPAVSILVARRLERQAQPGATDPFSWRLIGPAVPAAVVSLMVAQGDYALAATGREAARELCAKYAGAGRRLWFEGHWGFQYYMEQGGAKPLELDLAQVRPGDVVVIPSEAFNTIDVPNNLVRVVDMLSFLPKSGCATMSSSAGAGFYASSAGPFPFSAGHINPECFYVFEVVQTLAAATESPGGISLTGALAEQYGLERQALLWQQALRANPNDADAHLRLGKFFASRSRIDAAVKHFAEAVRLRPDDKPAQSELAFLLERQQARLEGTKHENDARTNGRH
jgi:4-amino-4-deoxy-L-arabinose transferase-like glycosyltransferase